MQLKVNKGSFASQSQNANRCSLRLQQPSQDLVHKHPPGHQGTLKRVMLGSCLFTDARRHYRQTDFVSPRIGCIGCIPSFPHIPGLKNEMMRMVQLKMPRIYRQAYVSDKTEENRPVKLVELNRG